MPEQANLDVVINSIANTAGFAMARAEMAALSGGGFTPLGGGMVNFGGSLTRDEQADAAAQLSTIETRSKAAAVAERDLAAEGNTVARTFGSMGVQGSEAVGRLSALGGVMASSGPLGLGIGAAIVALGGAYEIGKSMIDNADQQEAATKNLADAYGNLGEKVPTKQINDFIAANAKYIPNIYDAQNAYAALTRAGINQNETQADMNRILDLAALKHISLSDATDLVIKAEYGHMRGLIDLGVTTGKYTDANGDLIKSQHSVRKMWEEVDPKLKDGRKTLTDLQQANDSLGASWDKLTAGPGKGLQRTLAETSKGLADFLDWLQSPRLAAGVNYWEQQWSRLVSAVGGDVNATPGAPAHGGRAAVAFNQQHSHTVRVHVTAAPGLIAKHVSPGLRV